MINAHAHAYKERATCRQRIHQTYSQGHTTHTHSKAHALTHTHTHRYLGTHTHTRMHTESATQTCEARQRRFHFASPRKKSRSNRAARKHVKLASKTTRKDKRAKINACNHFGFRWSPCQHVKLALSREARTTQHVISSSTIA